MNPFADLKFSRQGIHNSECKDGERGRFDDPNEPHTGNWSPVMESFFSPQIGATTYTN